MKYTLNDLIHSKGITEIVQQAVMALRHENEELRARIEEMEQQKPVAWVRKLGLDLPSVVCVTDLTYRPSDTPKSSYIPLYLAPGAKGE